MATLCMLGAPRTLRKNKLLLLTLSRSPRMQIWGMTHRLSGWAPTGSSSFQLVELPSRNPYYGHSMEKCTSSIRLMVSVASGYPTNLSFRPMVQEPANQWLQHHPLAVWIRKTRFRRRLQLLWPTTPQKLRHLTSV